MNVTAIIMTVRCGVNLTLSNINKGWSLIMPEIKKPNHSISCNVKQCANHAKTSEYCALDKITVGTHEQNPTVCQCTDCESFILDARENGNCGCKRDETK